MHFKVKSNEDRDFVIVFRNMDAVGLLRDSCCGSKVKAYWSGFKSKTRGRELKLECT